MKKIIISVIAVLAVALLVSSCTFSVGILPRIGGTTWTYSAEINGVDFRGSLAFGKRTSFSEVDGTLTQTSPIGLTRLFTGAVNKYQLTIAPVSLGGTTAIKFEGEFQDHQTTTILVGKAYFTNDIEADPIVWEEGAWEGNLRSE
ncbi:MAG TPA: hypothetical protein PLN92_10135 [Thermotogota bacterium]|nr:hypothetical protein [Thermotogota bacterium]